MNVVILVVVYFLTNGTTQQHAIRAHNGLAECQRNAKDIIAADMKANKKLVREQHICLTFEDGGKNEMY